jgi:predicted phosphodiesterase
MHAHETIAPINRRAFLRNGSLFLLAASCSEKLWAADEARPKLRVGLVTDLHYADKPAGGTRYYRETLAKFTAAAEQFAKDKPEVYVHLGDLIDSGDSVAAELAFVKRMNEPFLALQGPKYYVLGNHCVERLTKTEFLDGVGQQKSFYSFDVGNTHFVALDACFTSDGKPYGRNNSKWDDSNIPASELEWLEADLKNASKPVIVLAHQRLDVIRQMSVKNAADVRKLLEASGKVRAVFQGHSHQNDLQEIGGIHYCTLRAMVEGSGPENNGYSLLDVFDDGTLRVSGFAKQSNYRWPT